VLLLNRHLASPAEKRKIITFLHAGEAKQAVKQYTARDLFIFLTR